MEEKTKFKIYEMEEIFFQILTYGHFPWKLSDIDSILDSKVKQNLFGKIELESKNSESEEKVIAIFCHLKILEYFNDG